MQPDTPEKTFPCFPVDVGIKDEDIPQLVSAMHRMPQMQDVRRGESIAAFSCSVCCMYTVQCQEDLLSMRRASRGRKVWRQSVASVGEEIPKLDIALYSMPHLHHVRC